VTLGIALVYLGAALAAGLGGIGSAIGVGLAGREGAGVMSEDPDKFGKLILLVALPGTQGIYGLLGFFMATAKLGPLADVLKTGDATSTAIGLSVMMACLPVALTCMISGIHQGKVCAGGVAMAAKRPEAVGKALIFGALVETYAVLGLIATILAFNGIQAPAAAG